jgi:hypothetical protein
MQRGLVTIPRCIRLMVIDLLCKSCIRKFRCCCLTR